MSYKACPCPLHPRYAPFITISSLVCTIAHGGVDLSDHRSLASRPQIVYYVRVRTGRSTRSPPRGTKDVVYKSEWYSYLRLLCRLVPPPWSPRSLLCRMRSLVYPSESLDDDIYLGFWINRSVGNFRGATLTLDRQRGSLLIACLALFVGATGRSLWKIIRCALHFRLSAQSLTDGVYQQRQAILRNSGLAHEAVIALLFSCHAWRKNGTPALRRTLPLALLAAILSAAFTIAGIVHRICIRPH